jgi:hypothetical protein
MSTEVTLTDLDLAAPPDRRVKLAGNTFKVPGDPPTGWLLAFRSLTSKFADDDADELEIVAQLRDAIVDLFCLRQPQAEEQIIAAVDSMGVPTLVQAVNLIYRAEVEAEPEPAPRPTRAAGTRSTSPSRKRASSASSSLSES